ncbi:MAG: VPLPA-CTERM sorting domain-containing protein [Pseudomonadota bacterium]
MHRLTVVCTVFLTVAAGHAAAATTTYSFDATLTGTFGSLAENTFVDTAAAASGISGTLVIDDTLVDTGVTFGGDPFFRYAPPTLDIAGLTPSPSVVPLSGTTVLPAGGQVTGNSESFQSGVTPADTYLLPTFNFLVEDPSILDRGDLPDFANLAAFASATITLTATEWDGTSFGNSEIALLEITSITEPGSTTVIPLPASAGFLMLAIGALAAQGARRRSKRRA